MPSQPEDPPRPQPADELSLRPDAAHPDPAVDVWDEPIFEPSPGRGGYGRQPEPSRWRAAGWVALVAIAAGVTFAGYRYWSTREAAPDAAPVAAAPSAPATAVPDGLEPPAGTRLGGDVAPLDLPPIDQSDAAVAGLVKTLSSHPRVLAWLATDGLIRNFTVVVENIAAGKTPARHLSTLRPSASFQTGGSADRPTVDPRSYRRYDTLAAAVTSIDPAGAARLYGGLRHRLDEAYRDLGHEMPFDGALERAIVLLLDVPLPAQPVRLTRAPKGIGYLYADPALESLAPAQKQLLRMGPENTRTVQASLRAIALALGIPQERLPTPPE